MEYSGKDNPPICDIQNKGNASSTDVLKNENSQCVIICLLVIGISQRDTDGSSVIATNDGDELPAELLSIGSNTRFSSVVPTGFDKILRMPALMALSVEMILVYKSKSIHLGCRRLSAINVSSTKYVTPTQLIKQIAATATFGNKNGYF